MNLTRLTTLTRLTRYLGWVLRRVSPLPYNGSPINNMAINGGPLG